MNEPQNTLLVVINNTYDHKNCHAWYQMEHPKLVSLGFQITCLAQKKKIWVSAVAILCGTNCCYVVDNYVNTTKTSTLKWGTKQQVLQYIRQNSHHCKYLTGQLGAKVCPHCGDKHWRVAKCRWQCCAIMEGPARTTYGSGGSPFRRSVSRKKMSLP